MSTKEEMYKLEKVAVQLVKEPPLLSSEKIVGPEDAIRILAQHLKDYDREVICIVNLKSNHAPINMTVCSMGALDQTIAHPRELLKSAFLSNAKAIIMVHNHPSGDIQPSIADISITDRICQICKMAEIPLLDHIIIGPQMEYFSFKEKRIMPISEERLTENLNDINLHVAEGEKGKDKIMEIKVKANRIEKSENGIRGLADITFGDSFKVRSVAVMENKDGGLFVSMPSYKTKAVGEDGKPVYKDICNPITKEFRDSLYAGILESYESEKSVVVSRKEGPLKYNVKAVTLEDTGNMTKGLARIYLEDEFVVNNVSIVENKDKELFMAMPSYKIKSVDKNGRSEYKDFCYPTSKEFRNELQVAVIEKYHESSEIKRDAADKDSPFVSKEEEQKCTEVSSQKNTDKSSIKKKLVEGESKKQSDKSQQPKTANTKKNKEAEIA